jgi:3'(2'), 5'-bisphosphate nucleotidase
MLSPFAAELAQIAHEAGRLILKHYASPVRVRVKSDESPVTAADEEAEALIESRLAIVSPGVPVIAEEAVASGRVPGLARQFFLVDPLDGTKEFLKKNGEFTVNIALIEDRRPICGVMVAPAKGRAFIGEGAGAAFEVEAPDNAPLDLSRIRPIRARRAPANGIVALVSRTHRDAKSEEYLSSYKIADFNAAGSSLKFGLIAAGEADLYPRHGPTSEWDTAAGQAVLEAAGGSVVTLDGAPLTYGKAEAAFRNPYFIASGLGPSG